MKEISKDKISDLAAHFGNAFYLLDSVQFENNFCDLSNAFCNIYSHFQIAYSYKTNYTPKLCRIVNNLGGYAEVVSDMEMEIALRIGVSPSKIIWNGPIKNEGKAEQLLVTGGTVNIDSAFELDSVKRIADKHPDKVLNIGIRCNFDVDDGVVSRFGFDTEGTDFQKAIEYVKLNRNVHLINLQCHFAKRSIKFWPERAKGMLKVADRVSEVIGYLPKRIDIGGGLYGNMEDALKRQFTESIPSYKDYAKAAATVFASHYACTSEKPELLIEPGSALVGDCMKFVGRVETVKNVRGKTFVTMLGSQKNISMGGVNPPMEVIPSGKDRIQYFDADIVGYTCIEGDVMYRGYNGELAVGDYLVFSNCGSYSVVMKPPFILPNFPVLDVCNGKTEVIKRQEYFDDLFHTFSFCEV